MKKNIVQSVNDVEEEVMLKGVTGNPVEQLELSNASMMIDVKGVLCGCAICNDAAKASFPACPSLPTAIVSPYRPSLTPLFS